MMTYTKVGNAGMGQLQSSGSKQLSERGNKLLAYWLYTLRERKDWTEEAGLLARELCRRETVGG